MTGLSTYALVTAAYWGFTLTDGALRMLVVLYFYRLGYSDLTIAFLFLFYEFFGIVTNLLGGWIAARAGLKTTLYGGLIVQIAALLMLAAWQPGWAEIVSVTYVMAAQALSGIAKDLTKMSAKSAVKLLVPAQAEGALFRWVARLTGSKNALKGAGFFLGGLLLATLSFAGALMAMAAALACVLLGTVAALPRDLGRSRKRVKFTALFAKSRAINRLSAARFFLFAARDIWFVVALPVFLSELGWPASATGGFLALWVVFYGVIQALVPDILRQFGTSAADGAAARFWGFVLTIVPLGLLGALGEGLNPNLALILGLALFALLFAINSAVHSYLILAYSADDDIALNVGFYYMANAGGRLLGTLLSGVVFQYWGFTGCLAGSAMLLFGAATLAPRDRVGTLDAAVAGED
jgi:hypothetical protein